MDKVFLAVSALVLVLLVYLGATWVITSALIWGLNGLLDIDLDSKFKFIWLLLIIVTSLLPKCPKVEAK